MPRAPLAFTRRSAVLCAAAVLLLSHTLTAQARRSALAGTWRSAPEETSLSSEFDQSVWGKNAKAVRTVAMVVTPTGEATLTVTRRVVDGRGRTVNGSTAIEEARLKLGVAGAAVAHRAELAVTVTSAERRYPDDAGARWALSGLRVGVTTFDDAPGRIEIRFDTPDGSGSFWQMLRRATPAAAAAPATPPA